MPPSSADPSWLEVAVVALVVADLAAVAAFVTAAVIEVAGLIAAFEDTWPAFGSYVAASDPFAGASSERQASRLGLTGVAGLRETGRN